MDTTIERLFCLPLSDKVRYKSLLSILLSRYDAATPEVQADAITRLCDCNISPQTLNVAINLILDESPPPASPQLFIPLPESDAMEVDEQLANDADSLFGDESDDESASHRYFD